MFVTLWFAAVQRAWQRMSACCAYHVCYCVCYVCVCGELRVYRYLAEQSVGLGFHRGMLLLFAAWQLGVRPFEMHSTAVCVHCDITLITRCNLCIGCPDLILGALEYMMLVKGCMLLRSVRLCGGCCL